MWSTASDQTQEFRSRSSCIQSVTVETHTEQHQIEHRNSEIVHPVINRQAQKHTHTSIHAAYTDTDTDRQSKTQVLFAANAKYKLYVELCEEYGHTGLN